MLKFGAASADIRPLFRAEGEWSEYDGALRLGYYLVVLCGPSLWMLAYVA